VTPVADVTFDRRSRANAAPVAVKPVPVAQLASSIKASDNGGAYDRLGETVILNSEWALSHLSSEKKTGIAPLPFGVAVIDNAIVCGEGVIFKMISGAPTIAAETIFEATSPRSVLPLTRDAGGTLQMPPDLKLGRLDRDHVYVFLRHLNDNNYGHWITEVLPKVAIVADHFDIRRLKFIVTRHRFLRPSWPMRKIYLDTLAALGVKRNQIVSMSREAVEVERLLYPLPMAEHPMTKAPRTIEILEGIRDRLITRGDAPRRLYVSRAKARTRRLLNEAQILRSLRDFGVTTVYPERLSFAGQVRLFAQAELVIGNCGANLTNAVFSPRGVKIFALTTEMMKDDFFWDLANLKAGKYFSLHGKAVAANPDIGSDFEINPVQFRDFLEQRVLPA
jgi:capsular polysaccharide biosynthesis protein